MLTKFLTVAAGVASVTAGTDVAVVDGIDFNNTKALLANPFVRVAVFGDSDDTSSPSGVTYFTRDGQVGYALYNLNNIDVISGVEGCAEGGLLYHIHDAWDNIEGTSATGGTACGKPNTQNHYDPGVACGAASNNPGCTTNGGCVGGSTAAGDQGYDCSPETFAVDPFVCEVGDLSNKFGKVQVIKNYFAAGHNFEPARPLQYFDALEGKSVVFHCNSGQRAFCAVIQ